MNPTGESGGGDAARLNYQSHTASRRASRTRVTVEAGHPLVIDAGPVP
nr:hypothetical protein OG999_46975 [Streptomyces sp. NBC_00886]